MVEIDKGGRAVTDGPAGTAAPPAHRRAGLPRGVAFFLVGFVLVMLLVSSTVPSPMYVIYQQQWHFSAAMLTLVFSIYALCILLSMLLFGSLSDTAGRRPVLAFALLVAAISMVVFATAQGVGWLLLARALQGIAVGTATGTLGAALMELSPPSAPARGTFVNSAAPTFGMAFGAIAAGLLVEYAPAPTTLSYVVLAVVFVVAGVLALFMRETAPNAGNGFRIRPRRVSVPPAGRGAFALLALALVADWAVGGLYMSLGPSVVAQIMHSDSHVLGGLVVTLLAGCGTVAQLLFGKLTGQRPILLGGVLMVLALAATLVALTQASAPVFFVATAVLGLGWGATFMGAFRGMAMLAEPTRRAEMLAAIYVVAYLSFSVPTIIAGIAARQAGLQTTTTVFIVAVGVLVLASLITLPVVARHRRRVAAASGSARTTPSH